MLSQIATVTVLRATSDSGIRAAAPEVDPGRGPHVDNSSMARRCALFLRHFSFGFCIFDSRLMILSISTESICLENVDFPII